MRILQSIYIRNNHCKGFTLKKDIKLVSMVIHQVPSDDECMMLKPILPQ